MQRAAPHALSWIVPFLLASPLAAKSTHSVEEAGPDYQKQGEYVGRVEWEGAPELFGVQVVALGKGQFDAYLLRGGLPGAGWDRSRLRWKFTLKDGVFRRNGTDHTLIFGEQRLHVRDGAGETTGELVRVVRRSPTLGQKPPKGATVLFDGSTAEHFYRARDQKAPEIGADGSLILARGSGGLYTKKPFGDCKLHLEFRLPFEPENGGQGRANSGCYLQGRYEVQILDSFGLEGKENECGGLYMTGVHPKVNMAFPPLTWQTFDIEFTAARWEGDERVQPATLTVYHNGVLVYEEQEERKGETTAAPTEEAPEPTPHYLQDHGHEIHYRNIWLVEK